MVPRTAMCVSLCILHFGQPVQYAKAVFLENENDVLMLILCLSYFIEGQTISEWIYEVIVSPKIWTKNCQDFCPV